MESNMSLQRIQAIMCIAALLLMFYIAPGFWEASKGNTSAQYIYAVCFIYVLWACGRTIINHFFKNTAKS